MNPEIFLRPLHNPDHYRFEQVNCYNCGSDEFEFFLQGEEDYTGKEGEFQFVKCKKCGLVYQNPRISRDQIKYFYDSEYIAHRKKKNWGMLTPLYEWAMNKHDRDKEKLVGKYMKLDTEKEVLDIGCAVGTFLLHINDKYNCKISGVDFKEGLEFPGFEKINFFEGLFHEQKMREQQFDLITMWHFFEHDYDPNKTLEKAKEVLKDDGIMVIEVPRLDSASFKIFGRKWPGVQAPQHTALYDKKNFIEMIEKHGFEVQEYLPYGAFPPYFYFFAGSYFKFIGKGMNLSKAILPYFIGQLILTPIMIFQKYLNLSMQTIICKKGTI